jgi:AAA+ superfamily predicted ATPase
LSDGLNPNFQELSRVNYIIKNMKIPFNLPFFSAKLIGYVGDLMGNKAPMSSMKLKKITSDLTFDDTIARELAGWKSQEVLEYLKSNCIG